MITRQIVLDTETTGINKIGLPYEGHNIIEIGIVELINRRLTGNNYHIYIKPTRLIEPEAYKIHGISNQFLVNKPFFSNIAQELLNFINGSELIIHNAPFDLGFLDYEFTKLKQNIPPISQMCKITDTLVLARKKFPKQRNSIDALSMRYCINNSKRKLHGALLDANILAEIYIAMTKVQSTLDFSIKTIKKTFIENNIKQINNSQTQLNIIYANKQEIIEHENQLNFIKKIIKKNKLEFNLK